MYINTRCTEVSEFQYDHGIVFWYDDYDNARSKSSYKRVFFDNVFLRTIPRYEGSTEYIRVPVEFYNWSFKAVKKYMPLNTAGWSRFRLWSPEAVLRQDCFSGPFFASNHPTAFNCVPCLRGNRSWHLYNETIFSEMAERRSQTPIFGVFHRKWIISLHIYHTAS